MFELDLSLRVQSTPSTMEISSTAAASTDSKVAMEDEEGRGTVLESMDEMASGLTTTVTEEDVLMTSLFQCDDTQRPEAAASGSKRPLVEDDDNSDDEMHKRPADPLGTPEEAKRMRCIIDGAFEGSGTVGTVVQPCDLPPQFALPPPLSNTFVLGNGGGSSSSSSSADPVGEDPWRHAGLMREYGGVKGWMAQFPAKGGKAKM